MTDVAHHPKSALETEAYLGTEWSRLLEKAPTATSGSYARAHPFLEETDGDILRSPRIQERVEHEGFYHGGTIVWSLARDLFPREPTTDECADLAMLELAAAAEAGDETAFLRTVNVMSWDTRPAEDFARAIRLALTAGAHLKAQRLAELGTANYPHHAELQRMAHVLAPPRVIAKKAPARPGTRADSEWIRTNAERYRGQWVALRDGELQGTSDSFEGLVRQIGNPKDTGVLVTKIS